MTDAGFGPMNKALREAYLPMIYQLAGAKDAVYWQCIRCGTVIETSLVNGRPTPPAVCAEDQGGCKRSADDTKFELASRGAPPERLEEAIRTVAGQEGLSPALLREDVAASLSLSGGGTLGPSFEELVLELGDAVHFSRPQDPILLLLWACQSWLGPDVLPERCLAYLAFTGPKSSGKSTATEIACALAGGTMISGGSEAAIRAILDGDETGSPPRALGIDEIDVKAKQLPDLEGIFRTGNRWKAEYPIRVPKAEGRGWETRRLNVGGPKVLNYRTDPEDALASRTILIEMRPHRDAEMIVRRLFDDPALERVRDSLEARAGDAKERWTSKRMEEHMTSAEFIARVERLQAQFPRGLQLGAILLAVNDALGFDAEDVISKYVAEQREDSLQAVREILAALHEEHTKESVDGEVRMANADVHAAVNYRLKDGGLPPVSVREWPRIRRELGIETTRRGRGLLLIFGPAARKALELEGSAA